MVSPPWRRINLIFIGAWICCCGGGGLRRKPTNGDQQEHCSITSGHRNQLRLSLAWRWISGLILDSLSWKDPFYRISGDFWNIVFWGGRIAEFCIRNGMDRHNPKQTQPLFLWTHAMNSSTTIIRLKRKRTDDPLQTLCRSSSNALTNQTWASTPPVPATTP